MDTSPAPPARPPARPPAIAGQPVVEHRALSDLGQPLGGRGQPVEQRHAAARVEAEGPGQPRSQPGHLDPVAHTVPPRGVVERDRPAPERLRQPLAEQFGDLASQPVPGQEHLETRAPVVIGGPGRVEAEDLGPGPDQRGRVPEPRAGGIKHRPHNPGVQQTGQLQPRNELTHHPSLPHAGERCTAGGRSMPPPSWTAPAPCPRSPCRSRCCGTGTPWGVTPPSRSSWTGPRPLPGPVPGGHVDQHRECVHHLSDRVRPDGRVEPDPPDQRVHQRPHQWVQARRRRRRRLRRACAVPAGHPAGRHPDLISCG